MIKRIKQIKKLNKILPLLVILFGLIFISSCTTNQVDANIIKIDVDIKASDNTFYIDEFDLSDYKLKLYLDNDLIEKVALSKDMFNEEDLEKLTKPGKHTLTVTYKGFTDEFTIVLTDLNESALFTLNIFELNDTHGYIEQNEDGKGGLSNTAQMIDNERLKNSLDDCLLVANGDMFQGTAISNLTEGKAVIDAMNEMDFDCMGIGNHEFDWGISKILRFFDNDKSNGEANFPLINSNIVERNTNKLLLLERGNMCESIIVEKEGINIGIFSFIGDVSSSIGTSVYASYLIKTDIETRAKRICAELKNNGADIILVNIHGGNSSGVEKYDYNQILSKIMYNGEYVVDAIINGHTHTRQKGYITRVGGVNVPVVQSSGNNASIGKIELVIDKSTKDVIDSSIYNLNVSDASYNANVESVIDEYTNTLTNEVYSIAGETVSSKTSVGIWAASILRKATGADIALINTGGIRSNGGIVKGENITVNNMYEIMPFNNQVCITHMKASDAYDLIDSSWYYYYTNLSIKDLENKDYYVTVVTVDYVFDKDYFPNNKLGKKLDLYTTDLLIMEARLHDVLYILDTNNIKIDQLVEYEYE